MILAKLLRQRCETGIVGAASLQALPGNPSLVHAETPVACLVDRGSHFGKTKLTAQALDWLREVREAFHGPE
jgi:hypothetical protein